MVSQNNIHLVIDKFVTKKDLFIPIPESREKSVLFSINEYDTARIINESMKYDLYIENLEDGDEIKLSKDESVSINDKDHPNPPLEYRLKVVDKTTGKVNLFLYKIVHTQTTNDFQYRQMISAIGNYDENFLYDGSSIKHFAGKRIYSTGLKNSMNLLSSLVASKDSILYSLNKILENPILKDERIVVKTSQEKRQSARSIIKNNRSFGLGKTYSTKIVQHSNTPINQYFVFMLRFSLAQLAKFKEKMMVDLSKTKEKLNKILSNSSLDPSKRKQHTTYQIDVLNKKIEFTNDFLATEDALETYVNKIFSSDSFKNVVPSSKRDASIIYQPYYSLVERKLFLPLYQGYSIDFSSSYSSILASPIKQTSKLFEVYCLLSIDYAIQNLGFLAIDDEMDYEHVIKHFVKDDYEFELYYSFDALDVSLAKEGEFYFINKDTRHISPDFFLILKKKGTPVSFTVIDAKCRKPFVVQKEIEDGKYENTVREYLSFRYSTNVNPFLNPKIVDSLFFLFPEDGNDQYFSKFNQLEYKFVKLALDGVEEKFIDDFEDYFSSYLD